MLWMHYHIASTLRKPFPLSYPFVGTTDWYSMISLTQVRPSLKSSNPAILMQPHVSQAKLVQNSVCCPLLLILVHKKCPVHMKDNRQTFWSFFFLCDQYFRSKVLLKQNGPKTINFFWKRPKKVKRW